jgi:hypothetical protein
MAEEKKPGWQLIASLNELAVMDDGNLVKLAEDAAPLKWKEIIYRSLCQLWPQDKPKDDGSGGQSIEQKKYLAKLSANVMRAKPGLHLDTTALELIRDYVSRMFGPGVYGPIFAMIDGDYEEIIEEQEASKP